MTFRSTLLIAALVFSGVGINASAAATASQDGANAPAAVAVDSPGPVVLQDDYQDVRRRKLDIQAVEIRNEPDKLRIRVRFPGVARQYDFPTGAVSVYLDTDSTRVGAEYGHFMEFWSDYRFAHVDGWRELPTPEWGHSPEGRCVATAGVRSDRKSRLRWFEYVVRRAEGCFEDESVRVAVSTINTGDREPWVEYPRPAWDHLGTKHSWSPWIPVAGQQRWFADRRKATDEL